MSRPENISDERCEKEKKTTENSEKANICEQIALESNRKRNEMGMGMEIESNGIELKGT